MGKISLLVWADDLPPTFLQQDASGPAAQGFHPSGVETAQISRKSSGRGAARTTEGSWRVT